MTREELIQSAKKLYDSEWPNEILKEALEETFPELKESEDERIRKALIQFLTNIKDISESGRTSWAVRRDDAEMCNGFLAYLEKQKENPKTVDSIPSFCVSDVKWADTIIARAIVALSDDVDYNRDETCKYRREIDDLKKLRDVLCGKKEQKPKEKSEKPIIPEWGEEDERNITTLHNILNLYQNLYDGGVIVSAGHRSDFLRRLTELSNWLKSLRPQPHWKPSEEQMETVHTLALKNEK